MSTQQQYIRQCNLVVSGAGEGLDLSNLDIVFLIKKTDAQTPNTAEIRVYNLANETANRIKKEFTEVTLQAGYSANYGVIFTGNIKKVSLGKENGTDTFLDISAGDGDQDYNFSTVSTTLAAGSTHADQIKAAAGEIAQGHIDKTGETKLPRSKVLHGMSRDYLRQNTQATDTSWSIQDGKLQIIKLTGVLPGQAIKLNSRTGLIGIPEQMTDGINATCLLNPLLKVGGKVQINESDVRESIDDSQQAKIVDDGFYRLISIEHIGDTRGNDWYSNLVCLGVDESLPEHEQVKKNG